MINSSTELENLHVSPPDAKPVLYEVLFINYKNYNNDIRTDLHVYYIRFVGSSTTYICNVDSLLEIIKVEGQQIEYIMLFEKSKQKFIKARKSLIYSLVTWNTELSELMHKLY